MNLLVTGGSGQVGTELRAIASSQKNVAISAPSRRELDLSSERDIARWITAKPWDAVINAAAYTQVDAAEQDEAVAAAVNAHAPERLARASAERDIPFIHISTDYVFDGKKGAPYVETDVVAPLNVYGSSKEAGERAVRAENPKHVILRTSWVYGADGKNFVKTMLRLAGERDRLSVVADQKGCPTAARDVASACFELARGISKQERSAFGTYHLAGGGEATWFEFAKTIFDLAGDRIGRVPDIAPIETAQYPTPARRPMDSRLDSSAIGRDWGIVPRPWRVALEQTLSQLLGPARVAEAVRAGRASR